MFPRDLVISGAGMDQTLLQFEDLTASGDVRNLTLRDFTFWNDGPLCDLRGRTRATITLERVRIVGFDCGAGGCEALGLTSTALRAIDCVFAGGYGSSPDSYCYLFDVRVPALATRFERCRFERLTLWHSPRDEWRVIFDSWTFDQIDASSRRGDLLPPGIEFVGSLPNFIDTFGKPRDETRRDLGEYFPGWEEKLGH